MQFHPIENSSDTAKICVPILIDRYKAKSVLDLGCNVGWWLYWFNKYGVTDVIGVDGDNMMDDLKIPKENYLCHDLTTELNIGRKFDLVLCLEVAEHIDINYADVIVNNAVNNSDVIFWSAADIGQGGHNHVNEQPIEYWIEKFKKAGYCATKMKNVLPDLPHDYYRKNAVEFIKKK